MATNRFDKPILSEYISQYTPIPFELLYAIGKANNDRVDKAYLELGNLFTKWSEFRSPSAVDTKRWYDLTIGSGQNIVNELAANPDLIKTAEGRAKIQSFINSRPYDELSNLQLSREGLLQRQKVNQQLMLNGKYNPLWHDVDFTNYDTTKGGIYNDISPLAYKSEVDLVKPFVDNLKPGFIRSDGLYNYTGVSTDRTDAELNKNLSSIMNTPEALKHIEVLQRTQGLTREAAENQFAATLFTAGREFAHENREADPYALLNYKAAVAGRKPQDYNPEVNTPREKLSATITSGVLSNIDKLHGNSKWLKANEQMLRGLAIRYAQAAQRGDEESAKRYTELQNEVAQAMDFNLLLTRRKDFREMYGDDIRFNSFDPEKVSAPKFTKVSTDFIDKYSTEVPDAALNRFLTIQFGKPSEVKTSNGTKLGYNIENSSRVLLPQYLAASMLGILNPEQTPGVDPGMFANITSGLAGTIAAVPAFAGNPVQGFAAVGSNLNFNSAKDDFVEKWRNGDIKDVSVTPLGSATAVGTLDGKQEYVKVKVRVPMQSFTDAGIDTSIIPGNSRNSRVQKGLNATVDKEGEAYEFIGYVPLNQDYQTAEEYNRTATNEWVGHTVGDQDRYHEFEVEQQRLR